MKRFNVKCNVGTAKYIVSYHDGEKAHKDGSDFFDIAIFKNTKKLDVFISQLQANGYKDEATLFINH